ncbi:hypothetical protein [Actinomadura rupiterrae]|uniref:hypothetical protein n=1 Tax=Actinomadura rupiterrae TaxID=559627 RepID=UPI0020A48A59|nr:hypothetical protein [Actinomadura rupiterrae]MCP2335149.1 hypothetical protein [Actinomadura rupiterrae]
MREEDFEDAPTGPLPRVLPAPDRPAQDGVMSPPPQGPDVATARHGPRRAPRPGALTSAIPLTWSVTGLIAVLLLGLFVALLWH